MQDCYFFGYGSLVNRRTHRYSPVVPARIRGWRRVWRCTPPQQYAFLAAVPDPSGEIEGVIVAVPGRDRAEIDHRERAYRPRPVADADHPLAHDPAIHVFAAESAEPMDPAKAILLSYIDVVVEGYLQHYGMAGAERFFALTEGWEAPVLDDRARPRYPRYQKVAPPVAAVVDAMLPKRATLID